MAAIDADCQALDLASKELAGMTDALARAEIDYEDAMDAALVAVEDEYRRRDERLPSERQRDAHARQRIDPEVRREFLQLERKVKHIKAWGEMRARALSARQSELSFLKAEGQAPQQQPAWTARSAA
ncbi:MAG TPA: hypothetical protein VFJ21_13900 [Mycobacteriales bacterium]|nr:hypothetical protein [Mycobacteriales bacterium]